MNEDEFIKEVNKEIKGVGSIRQLAINFGIEISELKAVIKQKLSPTGYAHRPSNVLVNEMGYKKVKHLYYTYEKKAQ